MGGIVRRSGKYIPFTEIGSRILDRCVALVIFLFNKQCNQRFIGSDLSGQFLGNHVSQRLLGTNQAETDIVPSEIIELICSGVPVIGRQRSAAPQIQLIFVVPGRIVYITAAYHFEHAFRRALWVCNGTVRIRSIPIPTPFA
jgi:hypothetical protein